MNQLPLSLLLLCSISIGVSMAAQAGVNAQLRLALQSPIQAALISFLVGTCLLAVVAFWQADRWFVQPLATIPWWAWLGGCFGAFNVAMAVFLAPKLGALLLASAIVTGQVLASLVFDQQGWLGFAKLEFSWSRIAGALLIIVGLYLVARK